MESPSESSPPDHKGRWGGGAASPIEAKDLFDEPVKRAFETWLDTLAGVLIEASFNSAQAYRRAEDAIIQVQGVLVLSRSLNNPAAFERVIMALPNKLLKE